MAVERNDEPLGLVLEAQGHRESILLDLEVPELVLEHDRHLLGILLARRWSGIATPGRLVRKVM